MRPREMTYRAELSRVSVDADGVSSAASYATDVAASAQPLAPAVSNDNEAPVDTGGWTITVLHRTDVRIGDHVDLTLPDGSVEGLLVDRLGTRPGRRRNSTEIRGRYRT